LVFVKELPETDSFHIEIICRCDLGRVLYRGSDDINHTAQLLLLLLFLGRSYWGTELRALLPIELLAILSFSRCVKAGADCVYSKRKWHLPQPQQNQQRQQQPRGDDQYPRPVLMNSVPGMLPFKRYSVIHLNTWKFLSTRCIVPVTRFVDKLDCRLLNNLEYNSSFKGHCSRYRSSFTHANPRISRQRKGHLRRRASLVDQEGSLSPGQFDSVSKITKQRGRR